MKKRKQEGAHGGGGGGRVEKMNSSALFATLWGQDKGD